MVSPFQSHCCHRSSSWHHRSSSITSPFQYHDVISPVPRCLRFSPMIFQLQSHGVIAPVPWHHRFNPMASPLQSHGVFSLVPWYIYSASIAEASVRMLLPASPLACTSRGRLTVFLSFVTRWERPLRMQMLAATTAQKHQGLLVRLAERACLCCGVWQGCDWL